jgi:N-methylhydantoinase B/oxoprolinase/acetone carboxylase alpha subunit
VQTAGGGGFGEPALRDPDSAERDARAGIATAP